MRQMHLLNFFLVKMTTIQQKTRLLSARHHHKEKNTHTNIYNLNEKNLNGRRKHTHTQALESTIRTKKWSPRSVVFLVYIYFWVRLKPHNHTAV